MSDVVEFLCIKIQAYLDDYKNSQTIPEDLFEGIITVDDIEQCISVLPDQYKTLGFALIRSYTRELQKNLQTVKQNLRKEYYRSLESLKTTDYDLAFPSVINRYRPDINPVAALYYDAREMTRNFNPEDERHIWLHSILVQPKLNNRILDALSSDIRELERIVKKYYWPLTQLDSHIPLELFHARQLIKDFSQYYVFFAGIRDYDPDQHH